MVSLGPELPSTETAKRKRADGNEESERVPSPPSQPHSPTATDKRRRVIGPSLPPGPLDERPSGADESDDESSSDDGVGPALPRSMGGTVRLAAMFPPRLPLLNIQIDEDPNARRSPVAEESQPAEGKEVLQREEWMLVPPKQEAWSSRVDPTKLRNRKFNTGMGAKAPAQVSDGDNALWTETPEQKRQRLADEVMGVRKPATEGGTTPRSKANASEDQATAQRIREYNVRSPHHVLPTTATLLWLC